MNYVGFLLHHYSRYLHGDINASSSVSFSEMVKLSVLSVKMYGLRLKPFHFVRAAAYRLSHP